MSVFPIIITLLLPLLVTSKSDDQSMLESIYNAVNKKEFNGFFAAKKVCYDDLGCFTNDGVMKSTEEVPQTPEKINTRFEIYTKSGHKSISYKDNSTLANVAEGTKLAIIIHGFTNNGQTQYLLDLKDALLAEVPAVIVTDWGDGAKAPYYTEAATNTQLVGRQIALLINKLKASRGIDPAHVHLLGFSLGAQVAGFAGKWSQDEYKWKFGRISAMDAAAPFFEGHPGSYLTKDDATYVDVIHTSAGLNILTGELGFAISIGHVDFYPNGGKKQPRCTGGLLDLACNHQTSTIYMTESLAAHSQCHFNSYHCTSYDDFSSKKCSETKPDSEMGYYSITHDGRGDQYLTTSSKAPYCNV